MSTDSEHIILSNISIEINRKPIKNMHLSVHPPNGRVSISVPQDRDLGVIRLFVISKLAWIKKQIKSFEEQERETERIYVSGETHFFQGKRYLLKLIEEEGPTRISIKGTKTIIMRVRPGISKDDKARAMKEWYRKELKKLIPDLIDKWESVIAVKSSAWGIKQMKTKWGSCNPDAKRIWLNLELAKKPKICLEYILVHELVHLHERNHNDRFVSLMDQFMPHWRRHRDVLNSLPIVHNDWGY